MFHGCNESKVRDPKDFLVYAWVFSIKPMLTASGAIPGEREWHFHGAHQCFCVSTPWFCFTPVLLPQDSPSNPSTHWQQQSSRRAFTGDSQDHWWSEWGRAVGQTRSCLTSLPPSLDSLLSVHLSITHPFHSLICSFIQQMK